MRIISLLYHDVVPTGAFGASGFCSPDANIYKLTAPEFAKHLASIRVLAERVDGQHEVFRVDR